MATPGSPFYSEFTTSNPATGGAADADSLPVATAARNGADDPAFVLVVTRVALGRYSVGGVIPAGYAGGDWVAISATATVGGVSGTAVLDTFQLGAASAVISTAVVPSAVEAAMARPKRVSGDAGEVEQHSIPDLIAADQYIRAVAAANSPGRGLRITQLRPGGTVDEHCGGRW